MGEPARLPRASELMDAARMARTLARMAHEILERHADLDAVVLVGVRTPRRAPGPPSGPRACARPRASEPPVGALDITLYRDDLTTIAAQPVLKGTDIPFSIDGRMVVLVDDVLFTGRTVRAALDELIDFGRPVAHRAGGAGGPRPPRAAHPRRLRRARPSPPPASEIVQVLLLGGGREGPGGAPRETGQRSAGAAARARKRAAKTKRKRKR